MIITKTPFRMSFFGGGTDMESFFRENGGAVLVISMIMSICTAFLVVKMSNKFKIIRKFI